MKASPPVKVVQKPDSVVTVEVMAESIVAISAGIKKLLAGPLNERALLLLITEACPMIGARYNKASVTQRQVKAVLQGIGQLEREYLK